MASHWGWWPLATSWLGYGVIHSALASRQVKSWVAARYPALAGWYRLGYNVVATITLLLPFGLAWSLRGDLLWQWEGSAAWISNGMALAALLAFWHSTRSYDMTAFLGLRPGSDDDTRLVLSSWYRHVRHSRYLFALILIWSRSMDPTMLLSAIAMTLYFVVGSRLEERKLLACFDDAQRQYCRQVPGLVPLPGRSIDAARARELEQLAADHLASHHLR